MVLARLLIVWLTSNYLLLHSCTHSSDDRDHKSAYELKGSTELNKKPMQGSPSILPDPNSREAVYRYIVTTDVNEVQESSCMTLTKNIRKETSTVSTEQDLTSLIKKYLPWIKDNYQEAEQCFVRLAYRVDRHLAGIATETFTDQMRFFYREFLVLSVVAINLDSLTRFNSSNYKTWLRDWYIYLSTEHFGRSLNWIESPEDFTTAGPYGKKAGSFEDN